MDELLEIKQWLLDESISCVTIELALDEVSTELSVPLDYGYWLASDGEPETQFVFSEVADRHPFPHHKNNLVVKGELSRWWHAENPQIVVIAEIFPVLKGKWSGRGRAGFPAGDNHFGVWDSAERAFNRARLWVKWAVLTQIDKEG